jgi:peroxiredoxin
MTLDRGQTAPDFRVLLPSGEETSLGEHRGHPLVLIFLRHLA